MKIVLSQFNPEWVLSGRGQKPTMLRLKMNVTGRIVAKFKVGQAVVVTDDNTIIPKGSIGGILEISEPYRNGFTQDVIRVRFEGDVIHQMKTHELKPLIQIS